MSHGRVVLWHRRRAVVIGSVGLEVWLWCGAWVGVVTARARECSLLPEFLVSGPYEIC